MLEQPEAGENSTDREWVAPDTMSGGPEVPPSDSDDIDASKKSQRSELQAAKDNLEQSQQEEHESEKEAVTVFVTGFGATAESYGEEWDSIREFDTGAIAFEAGEGISADAADYQAFQQLGPTPELLVEQVAALHKELEEKGINYVNLVGQSEGGGIAAAFAARYPERVAQLVLVSPAGLQGDDSRGRLMGRFIPHVLGGDTKRHAQVHGVREGIKRATKTGKIFMKRFLQKPAFHIGTETASIAEMNIAPYLKHAKEEGNFDISLLYAEGDKVFSSDSIEETLGEDPFQYVDRSMMYVQKKAPHNAMMTELPGAIRQILETGGATPDTENQLSAE